jgi:ABC-type multidrug transport system fused ATPase/permease subunit
VSQWVGHDLRRTVYQHIQRLSLAEHHESRSGDLIMRMTSDISSIQDFINSALLGILVNVLTLAGILGVMFYINWRFTLLALSIVPVLFVVVYVYARRIKAASRAVRKREGELLSGVAEVLSSIHVVQAFAREDYEDRRFVSESRYNVEAGLQARSVKARLSPIVDLTVATGMCLVLAYGGRLALAGELSAGVLVVFLLYLGKLYKPIRELSKMTDTVAKASVGYERVKEVLEIESRIRNLPDARPAPPFSGRIEFDRVSFGYDGESAVLSGELPDSAGPGRGDRRPLRRRQDDDRGTDRALLRSAVRSGPHRRHRYPRVHPEIPARSDQHRAPGHAALPRHHLGQHLLRPPRRVARGHHRRRQARQRTRLHRQPAAGLRDDGRRPRRDAVGRPAPTHRDRARDREKLADPDPRRADDRPRRGVRAGGHRGARSADEGTDVGRHRSPSQHDPPRRRDLRRQRITSGGMRHA